MSVSAAPLTRFFGIAPSGLGIRDLAFDDAADRVALEAFGDARAEGFVEVRAHDALRVGARERVAGAALGDERLLAGDQVRRCRRPSPTRAARDRQHGAQPAAPPRRRGGRARGPPRAAGARAGAERSLKLMSGRNTIRRGGVLGGRARPRAALSRRRCSVLQLTARGGDHARGDALPRPALADRRARAPRACARADVLPGRSQPVRQLGERAHRVVVDAGRRATRDRLGRDRARERVADLGQPRVARR